MDSDAARKTFFTVPYQERVVQYRELLLACFTLVSVQKQLGCFSLLSRGISPKKYEFVFERGLIGLSFPSMVVEVKTAYRKLAKRVHPD
jgi:hypothetical protein